MSRNMKYYAMMAASAIGQELTPDECKMLNRYLSDSNSRAE